MPNARPIELPRLLQRIALGGDAYAAADHMAIDRAQDGTGSLSRAVGFSPR